LVVGILAVFAFIPSHSSMRTYPSSCPTSSCRAQATTKCSTSSGTPEELLLEAITALRSDDQEKARSRLAQATAALKPGEATDEQIALMDLVASRCEVEVPTVKLSATVAAKQRIKAQKKIRSRLPNPGAVSGSSLVLPGTPSMAEAVAAAALKQRKNALAASAVFEAEQAKAEVTAAQAAEEVAGAKAAVEVPAAKFVEDADATEVMEEAEFAEAAEVAAAETAVAVAADPSVFIPSCPDGFEWGSTF